ncbi:hypothetical protein EHI47_37940 [Rhizobium leguminosarum]|uniref:Uncharacterized protein n=1 Tax=Rhizobium leguminosarum TaxID=384 RepID=A0A444HHU5_RHILE|nr:hypothetical protein EHI47_37940 [Rhizobium leguminosarum]
MRREIEPATAATATVRRHHPARGIIVDARAAVYPSIFFAFCAYKPLIEPLSLDEVHLDVMQSLKGMNIRAAHARAHG